MGGQEFRRPSASQVLAAVMLQVVQLSPTPILGGYFRPVEDLQFANAGNDPLGEGLVVVGPQAGVATNFQIRQTWQFVQLSNVLPLQPEDEVRNS